MHHTITRPHTDIQLRFGAGVLVLIITVCITSQLECSSSAALYVMYVLFIQLPECSTIIITGFTFASVKCTAAVSAPTGDRMYVVYGVRRYPLGHKKIFIVPIWIMDALIPCSGNDPRVHRFSREKSPGFVH